MTRREVIDTLAAHQEDLRARGVRSVSLFGSVARDEAGEHSDIDVLVEYEPDAAVGLFEFVRLRRYLSEILGRQVDLVTPDALREEVKAEILREAIHAA